MANHVDAVPQRTIVDGHVSTVKPAPKAFTDLLWVVVPEMDPHVPLGPCQWGAIHGTALPARGAAVQVGFGEGDIPRVLWWEGKGNNVKEWGAKGDGVTDDTEAIQGAIATGQKVVFPPSSGAYITSNPLVIDKLKSVGLQGLAGSAAVGSMPTIRYTPSDGRPIISAKLTQGLELKGLKIEAGSATYTGPMIDFNPGESARVSSLAVVENNWFAGGVGTSCGIHATSLINGSIQNNQFQTMKYGIVGWDGSAGIGPTNVIAIRGNGFSEMGTAAIVNMQQGVVIENNTFEPLASGAICPIARTGEVASGPYASAVAAGVLQEANVISGNWWGDVTGAGSFALGGLYSGVTVTGNLFDSGAKQPTNFIQLAGGTRGVAILGNHFGGSNAEASNAINGLAAGIVGVLISGNTFIGSALIKIANEGNITELVKTANG